MMKGNATVVGFLLGLSAGLAITLSQAETRGDGAERRLVVAHVVRGRVVESTIVRDCVWVGIYAALVAAGIGRFVAQGADPGAILCGALLLSALTASWREDWPDRFGRAGANSRTTDVLMHGMVGGLLAAAASVYWRKQHEENSRRLTPPPPPEAV